MARIKCAKSTRKRRNKILKAAKGYWGAKSKHFKMAKQAVMKSGNYAYIGRKQKKRDFRSLWITRISAQAKVRPNKFSVYARSQEVRHRTSTERCLRSLQSPIRKLSQSLLRRRRALFNQ